MRRVAWVLLAGLAGCGGASKHNAARGSGGTDAMGNGGSSGHGATGVAGNEPTPPMVVDAFETDETFVSPGLWMGFPSDSLPIGLPEVPHDGSALHLVGKTDDAGLDVFFHTGFPIENVWSGVRFWAQSDLPGSELRIAVAGPSPDYFKDLAQGLQWPEQIVQLSSDWQAVVVDFEDMGLGPDQLGPHEGPYGAVHFVIMPNTTYDLWIDDFAGQPLY